MKYFLLLFIFIWSLASSAQTYTFQVQKLPVNPYDSIIPCHDQVFLWGEDAGEGIGLEGVESYLGNSIYAWIKVQDSTLFWVEDSGITISKTNLRPYSERLKSNWELDSFKVHLDSILIDEREGTWTGYDFRELNKKQTERTTYQLSECALTKQIDTLNFQKDFVFKERILRNQADTILIQNGIEPNEEAYRTVWRIRLFNPRVTKIYSEMTEFALKSLLPQYALRSKSVWVFE